ncbi:hypothetical protein BKA83DRAFT_4316728 [Pisolithus microcarpus]|nr:hypothetical protein BKA83DRAFT_4316728 [Pisolithus microcarpus]
MLQRTLWCAFAGFEAVSCCPSANTVSRWPSTGGLPAEEDHDPLVDWRLDHLPSVNSTDHLIFETVSSLLQHWPNTRIRNGTLLYHGTWHSELPPGPDWAAFDPDQSVIFCGGLVEDDRCWHLTFMTTRPLNIVYFDGNSTAKLSIGSLYSQDIVAWGNSRITTLCSWGGEYNIVGYVSEVMLCNFTSGVRVVSFSNIVDPVMSRNTSSGFSPTFETRVRLDLSGLVSFYDTELVPSLVSSRFAKERWDHRLLNISTEDAMRVRARLEKALSRPAGRSSGIDWQALIRVVVDRYSERLQVVYYEPESLIDYAIKTQVQLRHMLMPYINDNITPCSIDTNVKELASDVLDWARPVYKLCATTHTSLLKDHAVTSWEKLLLDAVQGTMPEICRVVTKMWGWAKPDAEATQNMMNMWRKDINELMAWLDWNAWVKCRPEYVFLTTWPVGFPPPHGRARIPTPDDGSVPPPPSQSVPDLTPAPMATPLPRREDWQRPQPRCIRRIDPYDLGKWPPICKMFGSQYTLSTSR